MPWRRASLSALRSTATIRCTVPGAINSPSAVIEAAAITDNKPGLFVLQRSGRPVEGGVVDRSICGAVEPCHQIGVAQGAGLQPTIEIAAFLTRLGADLAGEPAARVAVAISTKTDMAEIVDLTSMTRIPGTTTLPWFLASATANADGTSATDLSRAWMTTMCEDVLHLDDYEHTSR
jgi:hypothetical protein